MRPATLADANAYARRFGRIERQHGNAFAVAWGIGWSAARNGRTFRNPFVIGCPSHVAFNMGADDCEAAA